MFAETGVFKWLFCLLTSHPHPPKQTKLLKILIIKYHTYRCPEIPSHPNHSWISSLHFHYALGSQMRLFQRTSTKTKSYANREHWISFYLFSAHSSIVKLCCRILLRITRSFQFLPTHRSYTTHTACSHNISLNFPMKIWFFAKWKWAKNTLKFKIRSTIWLLQKL